MEQINLHFFYFNPLYTGFHSRSLSKAIDILYDPFFHFCYELALETWAKGSFIKLQRLHWSTLARPFLSLTQTSCSSAFVGAPFVDSFHFGEAFTGWRALSIVSLAPQEVKDSTASHDSHHVHGYVMTMPSHLPPNPPFSLAQTFKTDCTNW